MNDWRERARCGPGQGYDPELWFPVGVGGTANDRQVARAKAVCRRCPVQPSCLEWSLATRQEAGIWGGMTEDERKALRLRRRLAGVG